MFRFWWNFRYSAIVDQPQPSHLQPELNLPLLNNSTPSISDVKLAKSVKVVANLLRQ
jgi:hypothetical protein